MISRTIDLDGPLHYADFEGEGQTIVCVHGLGGSHLNWAAVAPGLAQNARVVAPDLAGFGRSPLAGRSAAIRANRALLDRFIDTVSTDPVVLIGNSMGGMLSMMQAALRPEKISALILVDPALPRASGVRPDPLVAATFAAYAVPGVGEQFLRRRAKVLGPEGLVRETMRMCCVDPSRVPRDVFEAHVELARERMETMPWASKAFLEAARSLLGILARRRTYQEMMREVRAPTLIVQGARDRLVPLSAAKEALALRPDWSLAVFDDVGHTPQLEAPGRFIQTVSGWLADLGLAESAS